VNIDAPRYSAAKMLSVTHRKLIATQKSGPMTFTPHRIKTEVLAGLTVALALVPEAVAFAIVAGVPALVGLYAAFIVGLITAVFGGRPGMISGATGALAVVMVALVADHGIEYLFATVVLMGILQILAGVFKIVIFLAQMTQFQTAPAPPSEHHGPFNMLHGTWMSGSALYMMLGLVALTMFLIWATPKVTKRVSGLLPLSLSPLA